MAAPDTDSLADDLLIGAPQIARHIFGSDEERFTRRVYYLMGRAKCRLPSFRLGFQLAARKSTLRQWIIDQEACHG